MSGPKAPIQASATKIGKTLASQAERTPKARGESATPNAIKEELTSEQKFEKRSKASKLRQATLNFLQCNGH